LPPLRDVWATLVKLQHKHNPDLEIGKQSRLKHHLFEEHVAHERKQYFATADALKGRIKERIRGPYSKQTEAEKNLNLQITEASQAHGAERGKLRNAVHAQQLTFTLPIFSKFKSPHTLPDAVARYSADCIALPSENNDTAITADTEYLVRIRRTGNGPQDTLMHSHDISSLFQKVSYPSTGIDRHVKAISTLVIANQELCSRTLG
jgi:hypothetical protein